MRAAALIAGFGLAAATGVAAAADREVLAEPPSDLIVTVYRAPHRESGSIKLDDLNGFALVTETRLVRLPAGVSRVRFEGVADGIEPASALVTGFNGVVIEKNRDARLLSPSALVAAAVGKRVELLRTNRKTGKTERLTGTILSDAGVGVVFKTDQGVEALRCSGLPETFSFEPATDLSARPTLSVEVRSPRAVTQTITLSYLARGFDWAADYTANLSADGTRLDLGAWVTLANSNSVGFPSAHTQVIAGRVNRESNDSEPAMNAGFPVYASCWPQGTTSDLPAPAVYEIDKEERMFKKSVAADMAPAPAALAMREVSRSAGYVQQEQLGDLKLYRVPARTTLASRQSKQVRLMDRFGIPVSTVYGAEVYEPEDESAPAPAPAPAYRLLRTKNTAANHLGLPLPSGSVAVFGAVGDQRLLEHESNLHDTATDEEVEINMGRSPDVQVTAKKEKVSTGAAPEMLPLVPGVSLRSVKIGAANRVAISNARASGIEFELRLQLTAGARVVRADHALGAKNGRPIFRLHVPAHETVTVRYQTERTSDRILRTP